MSTGLTDVEFSSDCCEFCQAKPASRKQNVPFSILSTKNIFLRLVYQWLHSHTKDWRQRLVFDIRCMCVCIHTSSPENGDSLVFILCCLYQALATIITDKSHLLPVL